MERGVYFYAWFPRQHCYHPSLPPRRLRMAEEFDRYRATTLVWAAAGGGSISLPYLEQEAFGPVSARDRFYGFVNDSEFIAECDRRGIKVYASVNCFSEAHKLMKSGPLYQKPELQAIDYDVERGVSTAREERVSKEAPDVAA